GTLPQVLLAAQSTFGGLAALLQLHVVPAAKLIAAGPFCHPLRGFLCGSLTLAFRGSMPVWRRLRKCGMVAKGIRRADTGRGDE
ncbi:hypothetical protein EDB92DRAFT_1851529, partial [Lactarius akahatsu]